MKKDELTALGLTDEQADKVLAINGRDIEKHKKAAEDAKAETTTLQQQLSDRDKDLETLKAGAEDTEKVKQQLTDLQTKYNDETAKYQSRSLIAITPTPSRPPSMTARSSLPLRVRKPRLALTSWLLAAS